jgi:superfamily II DNA or RNA helicase
MNLRPYQIKAVESVLEQWKEKNSTLLVLPTGCG